MPLDPNRARWQEILDRHPAVAVETGAGRIGCRRAGGGEHVLLLHGIGSASGSWAFQLDGLSAHRAVTAWDAPGYGTSDRISKPTADAYADAAAALMDALEIDRAAVIGHSLGALVAARLARRRPDRVGGLVLSSPAAGHARLTAAERDAKRLARTGIFERLGPEAHADARAPRMLSADATADQLAHVRHEMAGLNAGGYSDAALLLAAGNLAADVATLTLPALVLCGDADVITPPAAVRAVAAAFPGSCPCHELPGVGHASYLEAPRLYNSLLETFLDGLE